MVIERIKNANVVINSAFRLKPSVNMQYLYRTRYLTRELSTRIVSAEKSI
jgi:hypothetical protein